MLKGFFFAHDPEEERVKRGKRKEERGERKKQKHSWLNKQNI